MSTLELETEDVLVDWYDLYERMDRAAYGLALLAEERAAPLDAERIRGKAQGLQLALSYMREYRRPA